MSISSFPTGTLLTVLVEMETAPWRSCVRCSSVLLPSGTFQVPLQPLDVSCAGCHFTVPPGLLSFCETVSLGRLD